jgi:hypothetical protein
MHLVIGHTGTFSGCSSVEGIDTNIQISWSHTSDLMMLLTHFYPPKRESPYRAHFVDSLAPFPGSIQFTHITQFTHDMHR